MKMRNEEIMAAFNTLQRWNAPNKELVVPIRLALKLRTLASSLETAAKVIEDTRVSLIRKNSGGGDSVDRDSEGWEQFQQDFAELMEAESSIEFESICESELESAEVSISIMDAIAIGPFLSQEP